MTCATVDCRRDDCRVCALAKEDQGTRRHPHELANRRLTKDDSRLPAKPKR